VNPKALTWLLMLYFLGGIIGVPMIAEHGDTAEKIALNIYFYGLVLIFAARIYYGLFGGRRSTEDESSDLPTETTEQTLVDKITTKAKDNPLIGFLIILCTVIIILGNVAKSIAEIGKLINSF